MQFSAPGQKLDALAWIVDVPALERQLADAVRFQPRIDVVSEPVPAALTVVCEGKASASRDALGVRYEVTRYPQHAVACRLEADQPHGEIARQWFNDKGEVLALLPLGGVGGRSVALVWSVDQFRAPGLMAQGAEEFAAAVREASHDALGALGACHRAGRSHALIAPLRPAVPVHAMPARELKDRAIAHRIAYRAHLRPSVRRVEYIFEPELEPE